MSITVKKSFRRKNPSQFIYEIIDGKPIYYRGYKEAVRNNLGVEAIKGCSTLQSEIVFFVLSNIYPFYDRKKYRILTNKLSLQLDSKNILSGDIVIYDKQVLTGDKINNKYPDVPPKYVIEIDTNADLSESSFMEYMTRKTEKLFEFGVEKVFWVITLTQQVIVALPKEDWLIKNWNKNIELFDGITMNIGRYLAEEGIKI
ncbi:Uma2 family endonuclease [Emticicia sp. C21]|uniref:Uma2 family endonuclease n=1 Tax=Emticicia sp. C21 TaxID=2302915 RepID=UPI000E34799C|nr:Uma2 family endonuclease [Emticicia sp. C21]RFS15571.1 Uma2 family endonuclease [Emticicia sp. C21]